MATEDKNQETKENQKAIKETKQTGLEDLSPDETENYADFLPGKDKTVLGILCSLVLTVLFGWLYAFVYPKDSEERSSFFAGWKIVLLGYLINGLLAFVIYIIVK